MGFKILDRIVLCLNTKAGIDCGVLCVLKCTLVEWLFYTHLFGRTFYGIFDYEENFGRSVFGVVFANWNISVFHLSRQDNSLLFIIRKLWLTTIMTFCHDISRYFDFTHLRFKELGICKNVVCIFRFRLSNKSKNC